MFNNHWKHRERRLTLAAWWAELENYLLLGMEMSERPARGGRPEPFRAASVISQFVRVDDDEIGGDR
jgi:hypothetical protein